MFSPNGFCDQSIHFVETNWKPPSCNVDGIIWKHFSRSPSTILKDATFSFSLGSVLMFTLILSSSVCGVAALVGVIEGKVFCHILYSHNNFCYISKLLHARDFLCPVLCQHSQLIPVSLTGVKCLDKCNGACERINSKGVWSSCEWVIKFCVAANISIRCAHSHQTRLDRCVFFD